MQTLRVGQLTDGCVSPDQLGTHDGESQLRRVQPVHPRCVARQSPRAHAVAKAVLAAPKLAAKRAANSTKSEREAAEAAIVAAVQECLHFCGALQPVMAVLTEHAALDIAEHLLGLFSLKQPLLSARAAACLQQLVQSASNTGALSADRVHMLLKVRLGTHFISK